MKKSFLPLILLLAAACTQQPRDTLDTLKSDFVCPPQSAKPMVWWHWLNGNITEDGLRKDILWMNSIGIGGFHVFDANMDSPQTVKERLDYMSPSWKHAFSGAIALADSLGMETVIAASPGWSCTGGPWVTPEDAMKKIVWRTLEVKGGAPVEATLPEPFSVSSRFQNIPIPEMHNGHATGAIQERYYADIAVMAVRFPDSRKSLRELGARVSSSGGNFTVEALTDGDLDNGDMLPAHPSGFGWVQYEFPRPVTFRGITFVSQKIRTGGHNGRIKALDSLQISDDGIHWKTHTPLYTGALSEQTLSFPAATARFWRYKKRNPQQTTYYGRVTAPAAPSAKFPEFVLHTDAPLNHFEEKAGYNIVHDIQNYPNEADAAPALEVVDITACCKDGVVRWNAPEGNWTLYRFGWSLTGKKNHPASPEATGLEVDKLDPQALCRYLHNYLDTYKDASGGRLGATGIQYLLIDSYESEGQNWTPRLPEEFRRRRGYDMMPFLPALAGVVVESGERTDEFLWDYRRTLGELFAENYDEASRVVREDYGMKGVFIESHEHGRNFPSDGMSIKKTAAYPMAAMWCPPGSIARRNRIHRFEEGTADIRESASVAHIYGQNLVAAESMTAAGSDASAYSYCPSKLKRTADNEFAAGVNRFVIHEVSHQPLDEVFPGYTIGIYGQWFNRHETWSRDAGDWISYLARTDAMLQKGRFVADFLYYYGEDTNITARFGEGGPDVPAGYSFDFASPEVLLKEISVRGGKLVTRSGMSYGLLYVDEGGLRRSPEIQKRLDALRKSGARIVEAGTVAAALEGTAPDVVFAQPASMRFVHRSHPAAEIYWLAHQADTPLRQEVSFRVSGRKPWLWHPEDGSMRELSYRFEDGRTVVPLDFTPDEAYFVVFAEPVAESSLNVRQPAAVSHAKVDGPWAVSFQSGRGASAGVTMTRLRDWTSYAEEGIRYFSGKAVYKTRFTFYPVKEQRYVINLGEVRELARVRLNGQATRVLWRAPFTVDVTDFLRPGENELEVEVTNLWVNRLVGDEQPGARRITFTTYPYFTAQDKPLSSGLLGPVTLTGYGEPSDFSVYPNPDFARRIVETPWVAALNGCDYDMVYGPYADTPAPEGYQPFYLSHYGRHGARSCSPDSRDLDAFQALEATLLSARAAGNLTVAGADLLEKCSFIIRETDGMLGRLTWRGQLEHKGIGNRMYEHFPEIFAPGAQVRALGSVYPRCLISMAACTGRLQALQPSLTVKMDCGERFQEFLHRASLPGDKPRRLKQYEDMLKAIRVEGDWTGSLFNNPAKTPADPKELSRQIFRLCRISSSFLEPPMSATDYMPLSCVYTWADHYNSRIFLAYARSIEYGGPRLHDLAPLADEFIRRADEAIAGGDTAADLRFGHDYTLLSLCSVFGLQGLDKWMDLEQARKCFVTSDYICFASNVQLVFYRSAAADRILFKCLINERETPIPALTAVSGPYYDWQEFKQFVFDFINKK